MARPSERIVWSVDQVELRPTDHVLEVGCGHGVAAALLAERVPEGRVLALDRSARMVEAARRRNAALVDAGRVDVVEGSFGQLGWEDVRFDHVFSLNVVAIAHDAERCLPEARRLLGPGGRIWWAMQDPPGATGRARGASELERALPHHGFEVLRSTTKALRDGSRITIVVGRRR